MFFVHYFTGYIFSGGSIDFGYRFILERKQCVDPGMVVLLFREYKTVTALLHILQQEETIPYGKPIMMLTGGNTLEVIITMSPDWSVFPIVPQHARQLQVYVPRGICQGEGADYLTNYHSC